MIRGPPPVAGAAGETEGGGCCGGFEILPERSTSGTTAADPRLTPDSF